MFKSKGYLYSLLFYFLKEGDYQPNNSARLMRKQLITSYNIYYVK